MPHDTSHANAGGQLAALVPCLSGDGDAKGRTDGLAFTLTGGRDRGHGSGMAVAVPGDPVCVTGATTHSLTSEGADASEDGSGRGTLSTNTDRTRGIPLIAQAFAENQRDEHRMLDSVSALSNGGGKPGQGYPAIVDASGYLVRRLIPRECESLMSLPPDWTRYRADGREIKDGPRYRLVGNGVVVNVAEWLARRMMAVAFPVKVPPISDKLIPRTEF